MLTVWCLTVAFLTPWAVGVPVTWLIRAGRVLRPTDWLWAPFFGLAILVATLQPLVVFAHLPLNRTVPWFVGAVVIAWFVLLACRSGRDSLHRFPVRVALLWLGAALASSIGTLTEGVERYRGNMLSDQYQYVALAQFLIEEPFSTSWPDVGQRPWLVQPMALKTDRLGQSVIHGFLAVVAGRDALELYFPTQALGPALLGLAVLLLAAQFRLDRRLATGAALAAVLAPGTAILQSLCFLSHALCVPTLIAFLAAVVRLSRGGGLRPLPCAAAAFGLGFAVYTEFAPLFLGAAGAALVAGWASGSISPRRSATVAAGLALAVALSPAAAAGAASVLNRGVRDGGHLTLGAPVPVWAACVWVNSDSAYRFVKANYAIKVRSFVFGSCALTAFGAGVLALGALVRRRGAIPVVVGAASLFVPPVLLWIVRSDHVYIISKLLWTLTPVLALFAVCAVGAFARAIRRAGVSASWSRQLSLGVFGSFVALWASHNVYEQQLYLDPGDIHTRAATRWNDHDLAELCADLRDRAPTDVLLVLGDEAGPPSTEATALCYHGRHHRIWLAPPGRVWWTNLDDVPAHQLTDLAMVPSNAIIVYPRHTSPPHTGAMVFRNDRYEIVTFSNVERNWVDRSSGGRAGRAP